MCFVDPTYEVALAGSFGLMSKFQWCSGSITAVQTMLPISAENYSSALNYRMDMLLALLLLVCNCPGYKTFLLYMLISILLKSASPLNARVLISTLNGSTFLFNISLATSQALLSTLSTAERITVGSPEVGHWQSTRQPYCWSKLNGCQSRIF